MIIGIDPSFTSTGVAVTTDTGEYLDSTCISANIKIYESITACQDAAFEVTEGLSEYLNPLVLKCIELYEQLTIIVEYPALATRSGAYLGILHGYLSVMLNSLSDTHKDLIKVIYVPPTACNSFTKNKTKTKSYLVNYCKQNNWVFKRLNNDICTAVIFCHLWIAIQEKSYKNSWFQHKVGE